MNDSSGRFIPADILTPTSSSSLSLVSMTEGSKKLKMTLNLLESLWTIQALKERHFNAWFYQLQELQMVEERKFVEDSTTNLNITNAIASTAANKRMKVADSIGTNTANTNIDFKLFENHCHVQLEIIQSTINYTLSNLLIEQQMILYEIGFPRFSLALIQQLKSCITTTTSTSTSNIIKYDTPQILEIINYQKRLVIGLLLLRLNPVLSNLFRDERDLSFYLSSFPTTTLTTTVVDAAVNNTLSNIQSTPFLQQQQLNSDGGINVNNIIDPLTDYYSFEAKTRRRKRRMQDINNNNSNNIIVDN